MNRYHEGLVSLVGKRIVSVRPFTKPELDHFYWQGEESYATVLTLDDGTMLVPMRDGEGNGAGFLEVIDPE